MPLAISRKMIGSSSLSRRSFRYYPLFPPLLPSLVHPAWYVRGLHAVSHISHPPSLTVPTRESDTRRSRYPTWCTCRALLDTQISFVTPKLTRRPRVPYLIVTRSPACSSRSSTSWVVSNYISKFL
jgi:hypothetical protein